MMGIRGREKPVEDEETCRAVLAMKNSKGNGYRDKTRQHIQRRQEERDRSGVIGGKDRAPKPQTHI